MNFVLTSAGATASVKAISCPSGWWQTRVDRVPSSPAASVDDAGADRGSSGRARDEILAASLQRVCESGQGAQPADVEEILETLEQRTPRLGGATAGSPGMRRMDGSRGC